MLERLGWKPIVKYALLYVIAPLAVVGAIAGLLFLALQAGLNGQRFRHPPVPGRNDLVNASAESFLVGGWESQSATSGLTIHFRADRTGLWFIRPNAKSRDAFDGVSNPFYWRVIRTLNPRSGFFMYLDIEHNDGQSKIYWLDFGNDPNHCRLGNLGLFRRLAPGAKSKTARVSEPGTLNPKR